MIWFLVGASGVHIGCCLNPVEGSFLLFRFVWWLDCLLLKEGASAFPREGGAAMTWHGCAGINPISGCSTPDDKYLPGRGVLLATPPTMSWRSARTWNLQACGVYFGASPKMMWSRILQTRAATVLVGGCCRRGSRNPPNGGSFVELSAWPSLCEAGELGSCYWMMRRFHGMARCVHLTAALLQAVYRSCLFASVEHIFHWLPLVHFNAWWARARHRIECRWC